MNDQNGETGSKRGRCLCGAVNFIVFGHVRPVIACHCKQCRQWSGHFWSATSCEDGGLKIESGEEQINWYQSSDFAKRAFCSQCGSNLFYKAFGIPELKDCTSISSGLFEDPTQFEFGRHIFCAYRGDYYELPENAEILDGHKS